MESEILSSSGDLIHYQVIGEGTPILMIHGYLANGDLFQHLAPDFTHKYQLILPDLRGYGRSTHLNGPFDTKQLAKDVFEVVEKLGLSKIHVLGYSKGGIVAQQFVRNYSQVVQSLVLGCTFAYKTVSVTERLQRSLLPYVVKRLGAKGLARFVFQSMSGGLEMHEDQWRSYKQMIMMNEDEKVVEGVKALLSFDSRPWLNEIQVPTLVIGGREDLVVPPHHQEMLAEKIPNSKLKFFDKAGHGLMFTHQNKFSETILQFLAEHPIS